MRTLSRWTGFDKYALGVIGVFVISMLLWIAVTCAQNNKRIRSLASEVETLHSAAKTAGDGPVLKGVKLEDAIR